METHTRKFFLFLLLAVIAGGCILIAEIREGAHITTKTASTPLLANSVVSIPPLPTDPTLGNPGADLVITEFVDIGNPLSRDLHSIFYRFVSNNPTKIHLIWKDLPKKHLFSGDPTLAHRGGVCARRQNKFWEYTNQLWSAKNRSSEHDILAVAEAVKLDVPSWLSCLKSAETASVVAANVNTATILGISQAPAVFINNKRLDTSRDINYEQLLSSLIAP